MNHSDYGFATRQIHAGARKDQNGSLSYPIYQTSTFAFDNVEQGGARFAGQEGGYIYTRLGNPSLTMLEDRLASLEGAEAALVTASGMGAVTTAIWSIVKSGDHILADDTLYGCTFALFNHGLTRLGVDTSFVDMANLDNIEKSIKPNTKMVYFESPCNPNLKLVDIAEVARIAHGVNPEIIVIVDNTFVTPYLQRPIELGADVVIHSMTKYLNGHGDVIAGSVIGKAEFIQTCRLFGLKDMTGAVLSPFDAFLITRGLKTLDIRMERHCQNARVVAEFIKSHPAVKKVYFPGFSDFPGYDIAKKQMKDSGGMIAFELNASKEQVAAMINKLELITIAVSLGDAETLIEHPATMTHSTYTAEELAVARISEGLVRLSVGLENPEDIVAALKAGLDTLV